MRRYSEQQWIQWGAHSLLEVLREQHAVTWAEAQARISDQRHPSAFYPIQPHILTTVRRQLLASKQIVETTDRTRGGGSITVLRLADTAKRETAIATASQRKRLLSARYLSWTRATKKYPMGLIGGAGERVVERSIEVAAPYGLRFAAAQGGQVGYLLGDKVEGGPLDGAVWADQTDERGRATGSVLCPIEVKNIRHWIYPRHWELFQLLFKAAKLQQRLEDVEICPVLVTRRKSVTANALSRDLGFRIFDVGQQFLLPVAEAPDEHYKTVRDELGFSDLVRTDEAQESVTGPLRRSLPRSARPNADRWREVGAHLHELYDVLRNTELSDSQRDDAVLALREDARELADLDGGW